MYDLEEKDRIARLMRMILGFGFATTSICILLILVFVPNSKTYTIVSVCFIYMVFLASHILMVRGYPNFGAIFFVFGLGAILTVTNLFFEGLQGLIFGGYTVIILMAFLILGWRMGVLTCVLSIFSTAAILLLQGKGWLPAIASRPTILNTWIAETTIFTWIMFLLFIGGRNLQDALTIARQKEQALSSSNTELQTIRATLETHTHNLERRVVQLQAAADVARDVASLQEVDKLLESVVNLVRDRFGFYHSGIFLLDKEKKYAVLRAATGEAGQKMIAEGYRLHIGEEGIVGHVTATGQPRISLDVGVDPDYFANPSLPDTRSEIALPLITGGRVIGALDVQSQQPSAFGEDDVKIIETIADQLAIAISNSRLFEAVRRQVDELTVLRTVAIAGAESTSEDELIQRITYLIAETFYSDNFGFLLVDAESQTLHYHPSYQERQKVTHSPIPFGRGIVGKVAQDGLPRRIKDVSQAIEYVAIDLQTRSELCVPIKISERVIGVINTESEKSNSFSQDDEGLLSTIAGQVATAIQKIRLFESASQRVAELEALHQASLSLTSSLDLKPLLQIILEQALKLVTADTAHLFLYDGEKLSFGAAYSTESAPQEAYYQPRLHGMTYRVAHSGEVMVVSDVRNHPIFADIPWDGAVVGMPIRSGERVLGVMNLAFHAYPHEFDENELRVLELLADQAAIAIINASLYAEAQERAQQLAEALTQREELDRLKDEFVQNVSHELRTPLAIAHGYIELLDKGEIGELNRDQKEAVIILTRRINMLIKLVDDLVVILESEAQGTGREPVNLNELVRRSVEDFEDAASQADLIITASLLDEPLMVIGNYSHLNRLLDNLIGNAIKFTPPEGEVQVKLEKDTFNAIINITDTGVGISPDKINLIFERFYQVDGSSKRRFRGIGLGLALVKEIADAHGGSVSVTSEVGRGSTFVVTLPLML